MRDNTRPIRIPLSILGAVNNVAITVPAAMMTLLGFLHDELYAQLQEG